MCEMCGERVEGEHEAVVEMVTFLMNTLEELVLEDGIEDITYTETVDRDTGFRSLTIEVIKR